MTEPRTHSSEGAGAPQQAVQESPHHGFQGDRGRRAERLTVPVSLTIAISREAGSRGGSIARRAGTKLGWQVYSQDLLEYIAQEGNARHALEEGLSPAAVRWVEERLEQLQQQHHLREKPSLVETARIVLTLAADGEVILIGRGAGFLLPRQSTLNVRLVAPLQDRIAYMSQWLRLTLEEAAREVQTRDQRRAEFIATHFQRQPGDIYQYDLLLNSSYLGEDLCAELIAQAARAKLAVWAATRLP
jgi:cytidylate kinase